MNILRPQWRDKMNPIENKELEQAVDDIAGSGEYRKEVDKYLSGLLLIGAGVGTVLAISGSYKDNNLMEGLGYGVLLGDAFVGVGIFAERYLLNYFSKVKAQRSE